MEVLTLNDPVRAIFLYSRNGLTSPTSLWSELESRTEHLLWYNVDYSTMDKVTWFSFVNEHDPQDDDRIVTDIVKTAKKASKAKELFLNDSESLLVEKEAVEKQSTADDEDEDDEREEELDL